MSINHYLDANIQPKLDIYAKELVANQYDINNLEVDNLNIVNKLTYGKIQSEPLGDSVIDTTGAVCKDLISADLNSTNAECENFTSDFRVTTSEIKTDEGVYSTTNNKTLQGGLTLGDIVYTPIQFLSTAILDSNWRLKITSLAEVLNIKGNAIFTSTATATVGDIIFKVESGNYPLPIKATDTIVSARGYGQFGVPIINSYELNSGLAASTLGTGEITLRYGVPDPFFWAGNTTIYFNFDIDILLS